MENISFRTRSLSPSESRVVLAMEEQGRREVDRAGVAQLLKLTPAAADRVISSLRKKGWLERASWGHYLLIRPNQGPDALGESNLLALASSIVKPYYIGYGTAAAHYGLTTQARNIIYLVTLQRRRSRRLLDAKVRIVNVVEHKFFGFESMDVMSYPVMLSDREKTAIDCVDRPDLCGGVGEAAQILATASRRFDWQRVTDYLERIGSISLVRQFGWLADYVQAEIPETVRDRLRRYVQSGINAVLGPAKAPPGAIGYDTRWRLSINVDADELHGSAGLGRRKSIKRGD